MLRLLTAIALATAAVLIGASATINYMFASSLGKNSLSSTVRVNLPPFGIASRALSTRFRSALSNWIGSTLADDPFVTVRVPLAVDVK